MKAVFLDKDGTLIENIPYGVDPDSIRLAPGAEKAIPLLHQSGYALIVVSNQSGVAKGIFPKESLAAIESKLRSMMAELGVPLRAFYFCPHSPEGVIEEYAKQCDCRKPRPGMLLSAARTMDIDLKSSWMIGDILDDVEAGRRAGCRTVLIDKGNETEWVLSKKRMPHHITANLLQAARVILACDDNAVRPRRIIIRRERKPRRRSVDVFTSIFPVKTNGDGSTRKV